MKITESTIPFNIRTIKVTKSRIDKGLLAVPVSLLDYFPKKKTKILISDGESREFVQNTFTPYSSSSRECRIGGLRSFYKKYGVIDGDEIVLHIIDDDKYSIFTEKLFNEIVEKTEKEFDNSREEENIISSINRLSSITNTSVTDTWSSEFYRLSEKQINARKRNQREITTRESVPLSIRRILEELYKGKCQLTDFTFKMRNRKSYFEVHHIKPDLGNHTKNLLVVSPNIHAQFTHAKVREYFDNDGWLRKVKLVDQEYPVFQFIDTIKEPFTKEIHSED